MADNLKRTTPDISTGTLVSEIIADAQALIRHEVSLAKVEFKEDWSRMKNVAVAFSLAGLVAAAAFVFFCLCGSQLLVEAGLPLWASYLIVGVILGAAGYFLLKGAEAKRRSIDVVPRQTIESIKESVQWIKNRT